MLKKKYNVDISQNLNVVRYTKEEKALSISKKSKLETFYSLKEPKELMEFLDINIKYGWLDKDKKQHDNSLKGFREDYVISSIEETLKSGVGTCIEQAKIIKAFFDKAGIDNKVYCHRAYETEDNFENEVRMHCFVLFRNADKWYHFEHSNCLKRGIHEYASVELAIEDITSSFKEKRRC